MKKELRKLLPYAIFKRLKNVYYFLTFYLFGDRSALTLIGSRTLTDKVVHNYTTYYEQHFSKFRYKSITLLEIGVYNGASVKMWEQYFPNAKIYAIDINPEAKQYETDRIKIFIGDQANINFLTEVVRQVNDQFDIIIDDGGHRMNQQINSLNFLYGHTKPGGFYVIEDLQSSYVGGYGGGEINKEGTTIAYIKQLIDTLCYPNGEKLYPEMFEYNLDSPIGIDNILSFHIYSKICFINKHLK
jgi:hypothetical protein